MLATMCSFSSRNQDCVCAQLHCFVAHGYPPYSWRRQPDGTCSSRCPGCSWINDDGGRCICDSVLTRNWDHSIVFADNAKWWNTCQNSCNLHFAQLLVPWRRFALCLWYCWEILCSGFRACNHGRDSGKSTIQWTAEILDFMLFAFMRPPSSKRSVWTVFPSSIDVRSNFGSSSSINLEQLGRHIKTSAPTNRVTFRFLTGCWKMWIRFQNQWRWTVPTSSVWWKLLKRPMEILDAFKGPELEFGTDASCRKKCAWEVLDGNVPEFGWRFSFEFLTFHQLQHTLRNHRNIRSSIVVTYRIVDVFSHCRIFWVSTAAVFSVLGTLPAKRRGVPRKFLT